MFIYKQGLEGAEVVEKDYFEQSIFSRQYRNALKMIEGFLDSQNSSDNQREVPHIVCFCGDRGEGKSSCMRTVAKILQSTGENSHQMFDVSSISKDAEDYLDSLRLNKVKDTTFFPLEVMDPSYFDDNHNILELVVGEIYKTIRKKASADGVYLDRVAYNQLIKATEEVKESLFYIHRDNEKSFSEITQLHLLAASVELKEAVKKMVTLFLKFVGAECLLLEIDDLDMNMAGTYEMCEQIRNYLSTPKCLILMATQYDQMEYAVALRMHRLATNRNQPEERTYFRNLARKYLLKFLPVQIRIYMPKVYESIVNQRMRIYTSDGQPIEEYKSIKDGVVKLIFRKTRYLFYNSKGGLSLIIPNNLRQLISLLNLLYGMDDIEDNNQPNDCFSLNQQIFKNYFFYSWSSQLPAKYMEVIIKWVEDTPFSQMNKSVVNWLALEFKTVIERTYGDSIDTENSQEYRNTVKNNIHSIINPDNFSYNVSTGDVFYLLNLLNSDYIDPDRTKMLFFIRSFYSILLYEQYDIVISDIGNKTESDNDEPEQSIYRKDPLFSAANDLQKILNGAYFNYVPGELLPTDTSKTFHFDTRVIKGAIPSSEKNTDSTGFGLSDLLKDCKVIIETYRHNPNPGDISKSEKDKIRLAEFFILTISRAIPNSDIPGLYSGSFDFRHESNPAHLNEFNQSTGYYVFDVMAPFANLANPKLCYERYSRICGGLYEFAIEQDFSLLRQLMETAASNRPNIDSTSTDGKLHALMSDAIIRNGEILTAIFENAKHSRFEDHTSKGLDAVCKFYDRIKLSGMYTHERSYREGDTHQIAFSFLEPLKDFIQSLIKPDEIEIDIKSKFNSIFDSVEQDRSINTPKSTKKSKSSTNKDKSGSPNINPERLNQKTDLLLNRLQELFGNKILGKNDKVVSEIKKIDTYSILEGIEDNDILPRTDGKNRMNYDVSKIIETLTKPRQRKKLDLWFKLFDIK